jgi:nucleotide sugar dehydrogenase
MRPAAQPRKKPPWKLRKPNSASARRREIRHPQRAEYAQEFDRIAKLVEQNRAAGREIVAVLGVGFVGAVMAAIIADTKNAAGQPGKFVIGVQRPSPRSFWKIHLLNRGESPVKAEDPEVDPMIRRCVLDKKTLVATYNEDVLKLVDCVVVDVQCDYLKESLGDLATGQADMAALEKSFGTIAERIRPECLVLIETTVAPGTTEQVAYPQFKKIFKKRGIAAEPLLAHSYERVMPGRDYVKSIRDFWRVCSGVNEPAKQRVVKFLNEVLNTKDFPLTVLDRPIESETAKIVENSYRATILAFLDEWSLFAEQNGVDLLKVIKAIKVRPTHSNIIFPGPGIGGYCLPKDGGLGMWAYKHILGWKDNIFKLTPTAINVNDTRGLRAAEMVRDALRNMDRPIAAAEVLLLGASYREDVGDTRYSGSELIVRKLSEMGPKSACTTLRPALVGNSRRRIPIPPTPTASSGSPQPGQARHPPRQPGPPGLPEGHGRGRSSPSATAPTWASPRTTWSRRSASRRPSSTASASSTTPRSGATSSWAAKSRASAAAM